MLYARFTIAAGGLAAATSYRNALDAQYGYPISPDPFDQHFADISANRPAFATPQGEQAWAFDISMALPLASNPTVQKTPMQLVDVVPLPSGATTFDWSTHDPEWTEQRTGP
jgi:hypothetical protein